MENQNQATKNFLLNGPMSETGRAVPGGLSKVRECQSIFYAIAPRCTQKKIKKHFVSPNHINGFNIIRN
ncbi:hypothetical protein EZ428_12430 [Pedobacter frigiditerrae]|uniref:Uncharacterized protein n=1 Tax=Pedobacter frigiditerrae TaxID=2530452 RepID=A0A4R0MSU2_9SPHI|nr:hypothetical protein [Pedobacter frigiditerrae]TCC90089.1 hypothetical protein EZ428_12430 [Pedobacter frigiditerrae]